MTITRKGHGRVTGRPTATADVRGTFGYQHVLRVGTTFPRPDTPFHGLGTRVMLTRVEGYTPARELHVPFRLQFPPNEAIQKTAQHNWAPYDVLDEEDGTSERSRSGGRRLKGVSISTFFMLDEEGEVPFDVWSPGPGLMNPILATRELQRICLEGVRFRLRIWNPKLYAEDDVNMIAVLTSCPVTEQTSEPDTRYVQMDFQEYRATQAERKAIHNQLGPWTHTIKDGDTLYRLARKYYKNAHDWRRIAHATKLLQNYPPSRNLIHYARAHKRKTMRIPQAVNAKVPVHI